MAAAISLLFSIASLAQGDAMSYQGRWAYSDSRTVGGNPSWVAITPAEETEEVWLSFWCSDDPQVVASVYDQRGFSNLGETAEIVLEDGAVLRTPLAPINDQVAMFPGALSERLFVYAAHAERIRIVLPDKRGLVNSYTFLLQPSDKALKTIVDGCLERGRGRER